MNSGRTKGINIPGVRQRDQYVINRAGMEEGIWQPLYDYHDIDNGLAATSEVYFQNPIGQNGKTLADTNMESAGQLPRPKFFLITSVHVAFFPTAVPTSLQAAAAQSEFNDAYNLLKSGYLDLFVGSKTYLNDGPLMRFPPDYRLAGTAALADVTTAGADLASKIDYATAAGPSYAIVPILLEPNQNFAVTLNWPGGRPLLNGESTTGQSTSRLGVYFNGYLYRLSQ